MLPNVNTHENNDNSSNKTNYTLGCRPTVVVPSKQKVQASAFHLQHGERFLANV